jgi:hypothetical protein
VRRSRAAANLTTTECSSAREDTIPDVFVDIDLGGADLGLALAALGAGVAWLLAAGWLYVSRLPTEPEPGPRTLDLGSETPAVANFLVNDFRVTGAAVPATLLDLAARNVIELEQRGPGVFYVRLRRAHDEPLTAYEHRVLEHLERLASDGVIPAQALTTGPHEESKKWRKAFEWEVVTDAKRRGLSQDALGGGAFTVLTAFSTVPGGLIWILTEFEVGTAAVIAAVAVLGWIRARHPQRETPAGLAAASRWLGVRAAIADDEELERQTPLTVAIWDRHLAYGAALGVAQGAIGPLPMGVESDTHAWSSYGGRWRPVRIVYPRLWPPLWGKDPIVAMVTGAGAVGAAVLVLYTFGAALLDSGAIGLAFFVVSCAVVVLGVAVAIVAWTDWLSSSEVTGPILRLRAFGDEKNRRYFVAVDDGTSRTVRAWRVSPERCQGLEQGQVITAHLTRNLCCVRWIVSAASTRAEAG